MPFKFWKMIPLPPFSNSISFISNNVASGANKKSLVRASFNCHRNVNKLWKCFWCAVKLQNRFGKLNNWKPNFPNASSRGGRSWEGKTSRKESTSEEREENFIIRKFSINSVFAIVRVDGREGTKTFSLCCARTYRK